MRTGASRLALALMTIGGCDPAEAGPVDGRNEAFLVHRTRLGMRVFAISAVTLACSILMPTAAQADCITPEYCVCAGDPNTVLDAIIQPGTGPDTVWLEVLETYGDPIELPDDGVVELPKLSQNAVFGDDDGKRALVYLEGSSVRGRVLVDDAENLDCNELDSPMGTEEGAHLTLMGWEACSAAVREREGLPETCDDNPSCSIGESAPVGSLALLGLLGLVRRGRRRRLT